MSNRPSQVRDSVGLLWLVAVAGTGLAIWAACTNFGDLSYRTCATPAATHAAPASRQAVPASARFTPDSEPAWGLAVVSPSPVTPDLASAPKLEFACAG